MAVRPVTLAPSGKLACHSICTYPSRGNMNTFSQISCTNSSIMMMRPNIYTSNRDFILYVRKRMNICQIMPILFWQLTVLLNFSAEVRFSQIPAQNLRTLNWNSGSRSAIWSNLRPNVPEPRTCPKMNKNNQKNWFSHVKFTRMYWPHHECAEESFWSKHQVYTRTNSLGWASQCVCTCNELTSHE